jgi:hypothetical protein
MPAIPISTFSHQIGPKSMIERIRKTWLIDMLDVHYTQLFQNSICEYGETPIDSNNPSLFCLDIARLWIKELLRFIHEDKPPKDDHFLRNFFRMTIAEFVQSYLARFGLSPEFAITCHHLGPDGIPSSVCQMSVAAKDIGKHIQMYHTTPLLVCDHHTTPLLVCHHFRPFSLSFTSKFVSLEEEKKQKDHNERLIKLLTQEKDSWFLCQLAKLSNPETGDRRGITQFLQQSLLPRCVFTATDALFCARFVQVRACK